MSQATAAVPGLLNRSIDRRDNLEGPEIPSIPTETFFRIVPKLHKKIQEDQEEERIQ